MLTFMQDQAPRSGDEIDELFREVKLGNLQVLKAPYETYKAEFMNFCARYGANQFDVLDAYQDAFVALVENVQYSGVETLRSGLKTYLFSI
ncbi:MAG: hypothetical protein OEQ53_20795, partial [Saprospiraceae bacterium]|nr:hypothetical protein [Saprospiraceae bacterium]